MRAKTRCLDFAEKERSLDTNETWTQVELKASLLTAKSLKKDENRRQLLSKLVGWRSKLTVLLLLSWLTEYHLPLLLARRGATLPRARVKLPQLLLPDPHGLDELAGAVEVCTSDIDVEESAGERGGGGHITLDHRRAGASSPTREGDLCVGLERVSSVVHHVPRGEEVVQRGDVEGATVLAGPVDVEVGEEGERHDFGVSSCAGGDVAGHQPRSFSACEDLAGQQVRVRSPSRHVPDARRVADEEGEEEDVVVELHVKHRLHKATGQSNAAHGHRSTAEGCRVGDRWTPRVELVGDLQECRKRRQVDFTLTVDDGQILRSKDTFSQRGCFGPLARSARVMKLILYPPSELPAVWEVAREPLL
eukprot:750733-Hanusia_phi.AAC.14